MKIKNFIDIAQQKNVAVANKSNIIATAQSVVENCIFV